MPLFKLITCQCCNELMSIDELSVMDGGKCILQLRGVRPFFSDKYDITKHPKYKYPRTSIRKMPLTLRNSYPPN